MVRGCACPSYLERGVVMVMISCEKAGVEQEVPKCGLVVIVS